MLKKGLSKAPEDYDGKVGHVNLALRIEKRDPGYGPKAGENVEFMYYINKKVKSDTKKLEDHIEEPSYIEEHGLKIDFFKVKKKLIS